jgi:hypothetical protein
MIELGSNLALEWRAPQVASGGRQYYYDVEPEVNGMDYDQDKVDEMTLALLWLNRSCCVFSKVRDRCHPQRMQMLRLRLALKDTKLC